MKVMESHNDFKHSTFFFERNHVYSSSTEHNYYLHVDGDMHFVNYTDILDSHI
jgi:hypothetical protein